jgi:hypothetical protein
MMVNHANSGEVDMDTPSKRIITRLKLYEQVWQRPTTLMAKEFGLSDVGFAKLCKRNDIPKPPRGYWAMLQAGKAPPREELPMPGRDWEIEITRHATKDKRKKLERERQFEEERKSEADRLDPLTASPSSILDKADKYTEEKPPYSGGYSAGTSTHYQDEAERKSEFFRKRWLYDRFNGRSR